MNFNIKCIGKLPGPTNKFERSLVFETGEFERPKFDCNCNFTIPFGGGSVVKCLTRDRGVADLSLTDITELCP